MVFGWLGRHVGVRWVHRLMWLTQAKFVVSVAIVVFHQEQVLFLRHSYRPRYPWGLPTGWVRPSETPEEAALREVAEEAAICLERVDWVASQRPTAHHLQLTYRGEVSTALAVGPSGDGEILEGRWLSLGDWPDGLLPSQVALIEAASTARNRMGGIHRQPVSGERCQSPKD
ncbi:MAG: NUDIX hydrolase [Thermaerobacter sp.]|nr:NUDIX hydrolase [Thermaerobacter sp.]